MSPEFVKLVLFILMACTAMAGFVVWSAVLASLRQDHRATWERLGRPSSVANSSLQSSWDVIRFVFSGQHRTLKDPRLNRLVRFSILNTSMMILLLVGFTIVDWGS